MKIMMSSVLLLSCAGSSFAGGPQAQPGSAVVRQNSNSPAPDLSDATGQKQWDEDVQSTFRKMKKLKRDLALLTHENNGLKAMLDGDHARAVSDYDALLALDPQQMDARLYRAASRSALGDAEGALADYTLALKQLTAVLGRGDARTQRRTRQLIARIHGDRASTYMRLGLKGDAVAFERALADCDEALRAGHPKPSIMIWQKSQILFSAGRHAEAAQAYQQALVVDPALAAVGDHAAFCRKFVEEKIAIGSCN